MGAFSMAGSSGVYQFPSGQKQQKALLWGAIVFGALFFLSRIVIVVPAGQKVVVFNSFNGVEPRVLSEGMNILVPFVQAPVYYDVRTMTYTLASNPDEASNSRDDSVTALTSDGQTVRLDLSVRYHLMPGDVWKLHQQVGPSFLDKIIRPEVRSVVRNTASNFTATDVYTGQRERFQDLIHQRITKTLSKYFISLDEVLVRNVSFSEEFSKAIELKQVALQEAERMKYILQKEQSEKERKIIEASGEAEAIKTRALALKQNPQLIQYEYVQKLSPGVKAIITDQKTLLNLGEFLKDNK
jgi:prohibitin 2